MISFSQNSRLAGWIVSSGLKYQQTDTLNCPSYAPLVGLNTLNTCPTIGLPGSSAFATCT